MIPEGDPRYQISADLALPEFKSKRTATMEIVGREKCSIY